MEDEDTFSLNALSSTGLNLRANTTPVAVGSVVFDYDDMINNKTVLELSSFPADLYFIHLRDKKGRMTYKKVFNF